MNSINDKDDPKRGTLMLIRHAERPPIPQHSFGNELSITPEGKVTSLNFGKKLGSNLHAIHVCEVQVVASFLFEFRYRPILT